MAAAAEEEALTLGLTPDEREHYEREGWVIKRNVFPRDECAALVERMTAVHDAGAPGYPGPPRAADDWNGFGNPHLYDEEIARWMLDQRLRAPLSDAMGGDEPEGIKSYWWYKVQQGFTTRHCDGTALPSCTGVWVPMVDVDGGVEVGTLALQSRSHRGRRIDHDFVQRSGPYTTHSADGEILAPLVAEIYEENERNGCELIKVVAEAGDAVIFHGHLFHHAVFGQDSERFRPVLACHYVPAGYRHWPHVLWERIDFNHERRWSDGTDVESEAARVNARLPQHPAMPSMRSPFAPSLLPARREGLRVCTTQQVTEMDTLGYTVFREAFSRAEISAIRDEIDVLEARRWAGGSSGGGGDRDINSNPDAITFSSGLVMESEVTRAFCGAEFFSDVCWDVLHAEDCRLYNEQVRQTPFFVRHFMLKPEHLSRQARDKHREHSKQDRCSRRPSTRSPQPDPMGATTQQRSPSRFTRTMDTASSSLCST
jgi:phytanoyl-CoA hydroxylase